MPEPLCDDPFDFEFERGVSAPDESKDALPKEEIQSMMFEEMVQLQLVMEDGGAGHDAKGCEGKDDGGPSTARTDATEPAEAK